MVPLRLVAILAGISLLLIPAAQSATISWTGPASGNWSTASSWSGGALPGSADSVVISNANIDADVKIELQNLTLSNNTTLYTIEAFGFVVEGTLSVLSGSVLHMRPGNLSFPSVILDGATIYGADTLTFVQFTCTGGGAVISPALQTGAQKTADASLLIDNCDLSAPGFWTNFGPITDGTPSVVRGTNQISKMTAYGRFDLAANSVLQSHTADGLWNSNLGSVTVAAGSLVEAPLILLLATMIQLPAVTSSGEVYFNATSEINCNQLTIYFTTSSETEYLTMVLGGVPATMSEEVRILVGFENGYVPTSDAEFVVARFLPGSNVTITDSHADGYNKSYTIGSDFVSVRIIGAAKQHKKRFPIWAIIVIAVVSAVIVVAGVGLVFYCRKPADYQTIR